MTFSNKDSSPERLSAYKLDDNLRDKIYDLLEKAKQQDPEYKQFGSSSRRYKLNPPANPKLLLALEKEYD